MTEQQKKRFVVWYRECEAKSRILTAEHVNRIDNACSVARAYVKAPNTIDTRVVREGFPF